MVRVETLFLLLLKNGLPERGTYVANYLKVFGRDAYAGRLLGFNGGVVGVLNIGRYHFFI